MRNLLALIGLAVVTFAGIGWYRGWYEVQKDRGTGQVEIDIDGKKIGEDLHRGSQHVQDAWESRGKGSSVGSEK